VTRLTQRRAGRTYLDTVTVTAKTVELDDHLGRLISPLGGVISGLEQLASSVTRSPHTVTLARLGDVSALRVAGTAHRFGVELDGIGCHRDPAMSARLAVMEALERYSAAVGDERAWVLASATEMGAAAIDLADAARCSAAEMAAGDFPLARWDRDAPLRWAAGWSLVSAREVWVPAVMSHLGVAPVHGAERFWLQTSSGCAAGTSLEQALLGACLEVVERDAVAIAWLQRLPLPRLPLPTGWTEDVDDSRIALFDATSDLGLPTALAVLLAPPGSGLPPAVGAGCAEALGTAAGKALRELTVVRACLWSEADSATPPADVPAEAFDHLLAAPGPVAPPCAVPAPTPVQARLMDVVGRLAAEAGDVVAVDLTPVELDGTGVRVVRVIVPALVPFLAHPGVRYLASRRLYEAPRRMGHRVRPEEEVNPWPSPLW